MGFITIIQLRLQLKKFTKITEAIENNELTIGIFFIYPKHLTLLILIGKLEHYGIRGIALEWFKNYH